MTSARDVWQAAADADNQHDLSGYEELFHPDVEVTLLGGQVLRGLDAYRAFMRSVLEGLPDYHATAQHVLSEDEVVMVHWTITGTHEGTLLGLAPTGRRVHYSGCSVWQVTDGKVTAGWMYPDRTTMQAQLGGV